MMLLWENGPADTSLYYALRICVEQALAEHSKRIAERRLRDLDDLEAEIIAKFVICIGNKMGKAPRKDTILCELQFNEMAKLLDKWDDFRQMLEENKTLWHELMDNERVKKFEVLLKERDKYFPVAESFVGSALSDTDEETFEDTNDKFEMYGNSEINDELLELYSESENWIKQKIGIVKLADLLDDLLLKNIFKNFWNNLHLIHLKIQKYSNDERLAKCQNEATDESLTKCRNQQKYSNDESCESRTENLCACAEYDDKYVKMLENMLKMKTLDSLFNVHHAHDLEGIQYNLIRTLPKNRVNELQISNEISTFISSPEFGRRNKTPILALKKGIESIVEDWAKQLTSIKPRLVTIGSHLMSADMEGSDLDLLCVVHNKINVRHFYGESGVDLFTLLKKKLKGIKNISWIDGKVKMVRIEHVNIEVDLSLVPVPEEYLSGTELLLDDDKLTRQMTYESGIYSLAGYKSAKFQLSLLISAQKEECISLRKAVKVWAKNRLIYSGIFGYFNGAALSVMATKICVLFPDAPLSYLLLQFFSIYSNWDWAHRVPVILDKLTPITMNQIVRFWPPIFSLAAMSVITPKFPEQNAAFNVNDFTFRTIIAELKIANEILSENIKKWQHIFEEIKFKDNFGHFALILCSAINFEEYSKNCAFQKSKIREKLLAWAKQESVAQRLEQFHLIPQSEEKIACRMKKTTAFGRLWLVGLTMKSEYHNENLTLNLLPIYDSDQLPALDVFWIRSFYAEAKNLKKRIEMLRHIKQ
uniref:polynucleotide adenylyltransferase n=1 Tax=Globodera rostochiensis TaxID=31243 RepID=A0A914I195_GLORO